MGPDKPSSFCNYLVELHISASCGAFTFRGRMRPKTKTSSQEQGAYFNWVETCERLSYVRASRSQAYDVFGQILSPAWCISIWVIVTLSFLSDSLPLQSSHSIFCLLLMDLRSWIWIGYFYIIIMIIVFTYLWCWHGSTFCLFMLILVCRCKHSTWLKLKWLK
jgi:hypothetical protein